MTFLIDELAFFIYLRSFCLELLSPFLFPVLLRLDPPGVITLLLPVAEYSVISTFCADSLLFLSKDDRILDPALFLKSSLVDYFSAVLDLSAKSLTRSASVI